MEFGLLFWATTFDFSGKFLIAITALLAHRIIVKEKGIDKIVLHDMKLEFTTGILGLILLVIGYSLHIMYFNTL